mmetsp:Transcript_24681/g.72372  ORF Transcript_24681/g.72372 Transcript_24681/m.72372 type:complete len:239 (+) Transcript_24681:440-1156(+)
MSTVPKQNRSSRKVSPATNGCPVHHRSASLPSSSCSQPRSAALIPPLSSLADSIQVDPIVTLGSARSSSTCDHPKPVPRATPLPLLPSPVLRNPSLLLPPPCCLRPRLHYQNPIPRAWKVHRSSLALVTTGCDLRRGHQSPVPGPWRIPFPRSLPLQCSARRSCRCSLSTNFATWRLRAGQAFPLQTAWRQPGPAIRAWGRSTSAHHSGSCSRGVLSHPQIECARWYPPRECQRAPLA